MPREKYLDYVDEIRESSLDWYATMRSLYRQKRKKRFLAGELEEKGLNILPVDVYNDPQLEESLAELTLEPLDNDNASDKTKDENIDDDKGCEKSPNLKKENEKTNAV